MSAQYQCLIAGAAGRDFHNFQTFFRQHPEFHVCGFTATQIPFIESRSYPQSLAGPDYAADIPIFPEEQLPELIKRFRIDFVFLAYSDLAYDTVMHTASLVQASGASFVLLGPEQTQLISQRPVIAVTAVRTGAGKSPLTRWIASHLSAAGQIPGIIRHPMPYGNLEQQRCQHFATESDLDHYDCTIEEREEYQPYLERGLSIYAGVDYELILRTAENNSNVILWDGGNNDFSFIKPDLLITVADALRPGHEVRYYPGETNLRMADVVVINKVSAATDADRALIREHVSQLNPNATVIEADLELVVDDPDQITGRRVLVIEDGPTLLHGGMATGAGYAAARKFGATDFLDPRNFAKGTIAAAYQKYPHMGPILPALGYSEQQRQELSETINGSGAELIIDATPAGLSHVVQTSLPIVRVRYEFQQRTGTPLEQIIQNVLKQ
ncbi:cyclic 2,3-diphosphoglycerate synthase [Gimesia panareensis]|uniref:Cyclic 2,3-diphosphoglycerate synthetase n=1 Tax=Gimesia panareensis TaxID=2527978 RepID=A0A518FTD8_9PLAN|nr:GTPase [Gimesia panareensis]QDU51665.1 Cyclic 2,3-diphosphoglycerate synthetase [Gimesia panareensis]QDV19604.1 Cyclic 2,3-diphosphoglycerate synthetase [Gimesia panareensis]